MYEALAGGPGWAQTLLVITYDEHGGCYDHVPPPSGATPPDDTAGEFGFGFTRFGVRVPAVLVSPLIEPGTVFRVPVGAAPLDHTSILKTMQQRWDLPSLTARDAAAPGFGNVLTLATPRTDRPIAGVRVPASGGQGPAVGEPSHLQEIQAELISRQFPAGTGTRRVSLAQRLPRPPTTKTTSGPTAPYGDCTSVAAASRSTRCAVARRDLLGLGRGPGAGDPSGTSAERRIHPASDQGSLAL